MRVREMCYACYSRQKGLADACYPRSCQSSFDLGLGQENLTSALGVQTLNCLCESFLESLSSTHCTPLVPSSSSSSHFSSCGKSPRDMHSHFRENGDVALDACHEHPKSSAANAEGSISSDSVINVVNIDDRSCNDKNTLDGKGKLTSAEVTSGSVALERHEDCTNNKGGLLGSTLDDVRSVVDGDESDGAENAIHSSNASLISSTETDPLLWKPPPPADVEDDMDSVANNEDDDEYSDGTKWGQSSCLSGFNMEHGSSFKEQRQKAMMDAMNGQFKILVSRFLASEDISFTDGGDGEKWLDIVASLSWDAALLVKPEANEGRAMDPGSYVKVKCIASGTRSQSEVIRGLVFKKNTAHKHMPTKCKNPRLLLLKGVLGHREVGLSSFESMKEEDEYVKSIHEMIESCHPNVVLVEKSVSRDMQEFLLSKGITLVFDMKLTRLNRISRCIGSPVLSCADIMTGPKAKQCDSFHIEKFYEEHNATEGGKKSIKTLMFLEGFPKPLGCTILLKGAPIVELKKVKRALQFTVFAAYHLILETSFFADQRALFPDMHAEQNDSFRGKAMLTDSGGDAPVVNASCIQGNLVRRAQANTSCVPSPNRSPENSIHIETYSDSNFKNGSLQSPRFGFDMFCSQFNHGDLLNDKFSNNIDIQSDSAAYPDHSWQFMSSFSSTLKKFLSDSFAPINDESMSSYFSVKEEELGSQSIGIYSVSPSPEAQDLEIVANGGLTSEKAYDEVSNIEKAEPLSSSNEVIEHNSGDVTITVETRNKDSLENVLDPQSILVLTSSQCIEKGVVCEQSHLSRIKFYGNFDMSLGRFLRDTLLNKDHSCSACGDPPEAHVYSYTHQNGNLTVMVRQLPPESSLSGETEGKIWMWTRCMKCEHETGFATPTPRVVMSTAARGLSFGKFLELSFSSHSVASRVSSKCGHSLHRDCLRFFGLGSKVAMFRYSPVEIYAACKPPPVLELSNSNGQEWIKREAKLVLQKGDQLFLEVADFLQKLKRGDFGQLQQQPKNSPAVKDLSPVEEMLLNEKSEFEASLLKAINFSGKLGKAVNEILSLSWLNQELLLELYVWDRRLHSLLQCAVDKNGTSQNDNSAQRITENCRMDLEFSSSDSNPAQNLHSMEMELKKESAEICENDVKTQSDASFHHDQTPRIGQSTASSPVLTNGHHEESLSYSDHMQADRSIAIPEQPGSTEAVARSELKTEDKTNGESSTISVLKERQLSISVSDNSLNSKLNDPNEWIWASAAQLKKIYREDLHGGSLRKFEYVRSYIPKYLSVMQLTGQEKELLHFPVGTDGSIISVSEDDISSIIACALALSEDRHSLMELSDEKDSEFKGEADRIFDNSSSSLSEGSVVSSYWSSAGSESQGIHPSRSVSSLSSDESSTSSSEASVDRLIASENHHPEIPVGGGKAGSRNNHSVVLVHAKQFYALRRMCCPSELAYISSLSRSKKWDAQGGKSKAFFAKTLDERFIIKQIKKTELDSFLKFAPDYFRHISHSVSSGSQTCLAKILGIYQVRQNRGGKETKTDLMVMENLLFGRNFTRTYDLKGAVYSRYIQDSNDREKVLLDENFMEDMRISPMYIAGKNKHLFQRAIWNDTSFLTSINVMDYSLLVGVDKQRREFVFGIIDYLRQYTWDKQLETWVKSSLVVPKNLEPTVVSPKDYKKRFRKFMSKYFLTVPDNWSSEQCSAPCKFCDDGTRSSSAENGHSSQTAAVSST